MKNFLAILFIFGLISINSFSQDQWYRTNGPSGGPIYSVLEKSSSKIFIGTNTGIYKSVNSGSLFTPTALYDNMIIQITALNNMLFAIDGNYLLLRSSNDGASWTNITTINMSSLFVFNGILFGIAPWNGIYKTTDNGNNWTLSANGLPVGLGDLSLTSFGNYLYCFRNYAMNVIYRSSDIGDSWRILDNDLPEFEGVNTFGTFKSNLFVNLSTSSGLMLYKSTNSGVNWVKLNNWDPQDYVNSFVQSGSYLMASVNNKGVLRSNDVGKTWKPANTGLSNLNSILLTKGASKIYANRFPNFSSGSLFQSTNNGNNWSELKNGLTTGNVSDMVLMNNTILAASSDGLVKSTNKGTNWSLSNTGLTSSSVSVLARKDNTSIVYAGTSDSGLYVSTNFGSSWTHTSLNTEYVYSISVSGSNIYVGTRMDGVYASTNSGINWTETTCEVMRVPAIASKGNYVYAGWRNTHSKPHGGIKVSSDKGLTWIDSDIPDGPVSSIGIFNNNYVIAASSNGVFRSTNFGVNWSMVNSGTIIGFPTDLITMGYGDVYVANSNGVAGSYNYGKTWELVSYGLLSKDCQVITGDMNTLLVSPPFFGVWRLPLSANFSISADSKINNNSLPDVFKLHQNYPNPFNPVTNIKFDLPSAGYVKLNVYNSLGKEVDVIVNDILEAGYYEYQWKSKNFASGIYFCKISTGNYINTIKLMLIK